jgi:hypothetical protein
MYVVQIAVVKGEIGEDPGFLIRAVGSNEGAFIVRMMYETAL